MKLYCVWQNVDTGNLFTIHDPFWKPEKPNARLLLKFEASTEEEAQRIIYRYMGWPNESEETEVAVLPEKGWWPSLRKTMQAVRSWLHLL